MYLPMETATPIRGDVGSRVTMCSTTCWRSVMSFAQYSCGVCKGCKLVTRLPLTTRYSIKQKMTVANRPGKYFEIETDTMPIQYCMCAM